MPDWIVIVILGIIEGITEFLPVSSTGHLLLAEHWLPRQSDLFNTVIQCGAVLAVLLIFTERLQSLVFRWREPEPREYLAKLAAAFFITGAGGLVLKKMDFELPETATPVMWATFIGGVLILAVESWLKGRPLRDFVSWPVALLVGLSQLVAAVAPGTSRSGITILVALALGTGRRAATEFSFLLGIPTLLAAGALQIALAVHKGKAGGEDWGMVILGSVVAAVTAFAAVKWLLRFVQSHTFIGFGWYRIALGILLFVLLMA